MNKLIFFGVLTAFLLIATIAANGKWMAFEFSLDCLIERPILSVLITKITTKFMLKTDENETNAK